MQKRLQSLEEFVSHQRSSNDERMKVGLLKQASKVARFYHPSQCLKLASLEC